jgi:ribosome-binding protein aMBF1 (putative translation factor)
MTKSFKELRDRMSADRQAKVASRTDELLATLPLHEIRQARMLSQVELAARLQVNQAAVSKVEHRADMYISTLRRHIEAMGGSLIIQAEFPEGRYQIDSFDEIARDTTEETAIVRDPGSSPG